MVKSLQNHCGKMPFLNNSLAFRARNGAIIRGGVLDSADVIPCLGQTQTLLFKVTHHPRLRQAFSLHPALPDKILFRQMIAEGKYQVLVTYRNGCFSGNSRRQ